jgi:hypothetical protein
MVGQPAESSSRRTSPPESVTISTNIVTAFDGGTHADLMEPVRPLVDRYVLRLLAER